MVIKCPKCNCSNIKIWHLSKETVCECSECKEFFPLPVMKSEEVAKGYKALDIKDKGEQRKAWKEHLENIAPNSTVIYEFAVMVTETEKGSALNSAAIWKNKSMAFQPKVVTIVNALLADAIKQNSHTILYEESPCGKDDM